ncbi:hypothetical protein [Streptomyces sp. NPDC058108]|uniref:hypothetical protein n=1 Tax=Streptomyces sp. NPDC058108 TaxID=3346344 RepID=UPI0036E32B08
MNIATGSILNLAPCTPDWVVALDYGNETEPEIVCPVIGWATVIEAHLTDGTATTAVQPAFLYLDTVWTPTELREHDHEVNGYEIRAREITRTTTAAWAASLCPVHDAGETDGTPCSCTDRCVRCTLRFTEADAATDSITDTCSTCLRSA